MEYKLYSGKTLILEERPYEVAFNIEWIADEIVPATSFLDSGDKGFVHFSFGHPDGYLRKIVINFEKFRFLLGDMVKFFQNYNGKAHSSSFKSCILELMGTARTYEYCEKRKDYRYLWDKEKQKIKVSGIYSKKTSEEGLVYFLMEYQKEKDFCILLEADTLFKVLKEACTVENFINKKINEYVNAGLHF